jgi:hypothetical protein
MKNRLSLCSSYLYEVEEKLLELRLSVADKSLEAAMISEALRFVHESRKSVSSARSWVEGFITDHPPPSQKRLP